MGEERVRRGGGREEDDEWNVEDDDEKKVKKRNRRDECYDESTGPLMERNYICFLTGYINQLVKYIIMHGIASRPLEAQNNQ